MRGYYKSPGEKVGKWCGGRGGGGGQEDEKDVGWHGHRYWPVAGPGGGKRKKPRMRLRS